MNWHPQAATPEQVQQTRRVEKALCDEINLLAREGVPAAALLAGLSTAVADFIVCAKGPQAVAPWFRAQADFIDRICRDNLT